MAPETDPEPTPTVLADVLLVDAPLGDRGLVERVIRDLGLAMAVHEVPGDTLGVQRAAAQLGGRPAIVLVDGSGGVERATVAVRSVRGRPELGCAPVVVLGEFARVEDVVQLLRAGADSAVVKPSFVDLHVRTVREVLRYWTHLAVLPPARMSAGPDLPDRVGAGSCSESYGGVAGLDVAR